MDHYTRSWSDGKRPIELELPAIIHEFICLLPRQKQARIDELAKQELRNEELRISGERESQRYFEKSLFEEAIREAKVFRDHQDLDAYLNHLEIQYSEKYVDFSEQAIKWFSMIRKIALGQNPTVKSYSELIAVTGYLPPPNSIGVLHFDCQHNFFIQIEGKKRWNISQKAAVVNPYENLLYPGTTQKFIDEMMAQGYEILLPRDCGRKIYELNPGDVLYVPPGFYHSPETLNETSLHYTLTIEPACFWKDFNKNMFAKLLSSKGNFFADYRFLNGDQKYELISECIDLLMKDSK